MKKWFTLGAFFFVSYLVFIIATLPLAFVINHSELPKNITIQAVSGTLWNGEIAQITVDNQVIKKVETQLSFWSLFTLMPEIDIVFGSDVLPGPQGTFTLAISQSMLQLSDVSVFIPADNIAKRLQLPLPITAKGEVELQLSGMSIELNTFQCLEAKGQVNWSRGSVMAMQKNIVLGKLTANIDCEKGKLLAKIAPKNNIGLSFSAYLGSNGNKVNVSGSGHLKPGVKFPPELKSALPFLGKADAQGRYRLRF
jgi:general secretion pathway protein N